jgi:hypothetical protein
LKRGFDDVDLRRSERVQAEKLQRWPEVARLAGQVPFGV